MAVVKGERQINGVLRFQSACGFNVEWRSFERVRVDADNHQLFVLMRFVVQNNERNKSEGCWLFKKPRIHVVARKLKRRPALEVALDHFEMQSQIETVSTYGRSLCCSALTLHPFVRKGLRRGDEKGDFSWRDEWASCSCRQVVGKVTGSRVLVVKRSPWCVGFHRTFSARVGLVPKFGGSGMNVKSRPIHGVREDG